MKAALSLYRGGCTATEGAYVAEVVLTSPPLATRLTALDESRYNPAAVENGISACSVLHGRRVPLR